MSSSRLCPLDLPRLSSQPFMLGTSMLHSSSPDRPGPIIPTHQGHGKAPLPGLDVFLACSSFKSSKSLKYFFLLQAHSLTLTFGEMTYFTSLRLNGLNSYLFHFLPQICHEPFFPYPFNSIPRGLTSLRLCFFSHLLSPFRYSDIFLFMSSILACSNLIPKIPFPQFCYLSNCRILHFISIICQTNPK